MPACLILLMTPLPIEITQDSPPLASNDTMTQMTRKWETLYRNHIYRYFSKVVSSVSLCHEPVPSVEMDEKRRFSFRSQVESMLPVQRSVSVDCSTANAFRRCVYLAWRFARSLSTAR